MGDIQDEWNFPGRPEHPDYWRLSECVLAADAEAAEYGRDGFESVISGLVDPHSISYMTEQRMLRIVMSGVSELSLSMSLDQWNKVALLLQSALVDGFVMGAKYIQAGGHREVASGV